MDNTRKLRIALTGVVGSALALAMGVPTFAADVNQSRLENADTEPQNWILPMQNYSSHRFSRLSQINRDNVADLRPVFTVPLNDALRGRNLADLENSPLVDDGFLYTDTNGMVYKIDVSDGRRGIVVWKTDLTLAVEESARTRGIAFWDNLVIRNLTDGRVVAVDKDSGEIVWDQQIARVPHPGAAGIEAEANERFTSTPLVANGVVLVGNSNGDGGMRGWIAGVDAETGTETWRFYTVPGPGEPGHETWEDDHDAWKTGGAAIWTIGSYDVEQKLYIQGTAQPVPMFDPEFRPGDNLFSNSALALNVDDGTLKWYFQYTPNESWDYDEQGVHMLIDAEFNGEPRQMVTHFARNGYYYTLDRTNGTFIDATQYVDQITWTAGLDPKTGLPVEYDPNLALQTYVPETRWARADVDMKQACPALPGGVRWQPPAYDPEKQLAYVFGEDGCATRAITVSITLPDGGIDEGGPDAGRARPGAFDSFVRGQITAMDATTGDMVQQISLPYPNRAGGIATAGGLLFTGNQDGTVAAYNSDTLEELWSFNTGIAFKAPPITYRAGGKQYIAINAGAQLFNAPELGDRGWGAMLYVFALGD
ncbi:MAG: PQQ-binding-like beta-propeller repeat protein [Bauldia sp.]|nr:PQQ-binding-like beta-propeller repeat protein [Bauldia sp.]